MKDTDGIESVYGKIGRHERYYLEHRPKKGCNIRAKSIEDPVKRLEKIAHVSAMLEIDYCSFVIGVDPPKGTHLVSQLLSNC